MSNSVQFLEKYLKGVAEILNLEIYSTFKRVPSSTESKHGHNFLANQVSAQGSGVRFAFDTDASEITLDLGFESLLFPGQDRLPVQLVLEVDGTRSKVQADNIRYQLISAEPLNGDPEFRPIKFALGQPGTLKQVKIWLPHNAKTFIREIEVAGTVTETKSNRPKWLHYGSSISHCSEADIPTGVWPVVASDQLQLDLVNLGLGGNAMLEPYITDVILNHNPDFVSMKVGINSINAASHTLRTFIPAVYGLIETLRAKKSDIKLLLISPIFCPPHEDGYGPTIFNFDTLKAEANPNPAPEMYPANLNNKRVREALISIAEALDVHYISGLDLMGEQDAHFLEDDLHPNAEGYALMGERFANHPVTKAWLAS